MFKKWVFQFSDIPLSSPLSFMEIKKSKILTSVTQSSYKCTVSVDCAIFGFQDGELKLMLVKRAMEPFKDYWMLPGGVVGEGQSLTEALNYVLHHLTDIQSLHIEQVKCYGEVDRHPVQRVIGVGFYALVKPDNHPVIPKNYISEINWFSLAELPELGFDHDELYADALEKLKTNLKEKLIFGELLPDVFTLKELQDLYESVLDEKLDRRNFRKKILQNGLLEKTNQKKSGVKGGPDLYRLKLA